jgi:hypothetical protein
MPQLDYDRYDHDLQAETMKLAEHVDGSQLEASGDPQLLASWLEHSRLEPA